MSQGTLLIVNGKAASQPALREAVTAQREQGWELAVRVTWEAGDAARYADEAADLGGIFDLAGIGPQVEENEQQRPHAG